VMELIPDIFMAACKAYRDLSSGGRRFGIPSSIK